MIRSGKLLLAALVGVVASLGSFAPAVEAADPEKPKAPAAEAAPEAAKDASVLKAKLTKKKIKRRWRGQERTWTTLTLEVTNTGKEALVLPYPLEIKIVAKDAAGKEVPARENQRRRGEPEKKDGEKDKDKGDKKEEEKPKRDPKKAVTLVVFKPGQKLSVECRRALYMVAFPEKGKYKVSAVLELEPEKEAVVPGLKLWSGKLKSKELEWEVTRVWNPRPRPAPKQDPKKETAKAEEF
jgi:hypothetical protein